MSSDVSEFGKDHNLISEVIVTGRKVGAGKGFWAVLAHDKALFVQVVAVVSGESSVRHDNHWVDPTHARSAHGYAVKMHISRERFKWDPDRIKIAQCVRRARQTPLNLDACDLLLRKPYLVPREWWCKHIIFRGTVFHCSQRGDLFPVLYVDKNGGLDQSYVNEDQCWTASALHEAYME